MRRASSILRDVALLALRLDRAVPGTIEAFTGDAALRRHVQAEPAPRPSELVRAARRLRSILPDARLEPRRAAFVDSELGALERTARTLAGERAGFREEVEETFDVPVVTGDPDVYRAAHRELDGLLRGPGSLAGRLALYRRSDELPPAALGPAVGALVTALRARTGARIGLPAGEGVDVELVSGRPWTGFTRYLGGARSRVRFAADARVRAGQLALLVAHETYPGHHTEHCRRDAMAAARPERALSLARSPRALVVEGAADAGLAAVVGEQWGRWAGEVLADVGVSTDGELARRVDEAMVPLHRARLDAAVMIHERGAGPDEVVAHLCRWLLVDESRAHRMLDFLVHPQWRTYTATYVEGFPLVRAWLRCAPGDPAERLARLLDEPLVPAALRRDLRAADPATAGRVAADRVAVARSATTGGVDHTMNGRPFC
ncbi:MAG: DUF885 domain-containing protein [Pseudonocardia sp.]|nr:DUF885 domain-containing protein [Pseudonocardia sp.]